MVAGNLADLGRATWGEEPFELWGELRPEDEAQWTAASEARTSLPGIVFAAFREKERSKEGYVVTLSFDKDGKPGGFAVGDTVGAAGSVTNVGNGEDELRAALKRNFLAGPIMITSTVERGRVR